MYIITGAAGMIGSALIWQLNEIGIKHIVLVDKLRNEDKWLNIRKREYEDWVDKDNLFTWLENPNNIIELKGIVHMGACSATTEQDGDFLMENNYEYSKKLWNVATKLGIPYIYASSAATYGDGNLGYNDDVSSEKLQKLLPLNKYGYSKKIFDDWALKQKNTPSQWMGLKFFNVYGPQEYHKGRMASMIFHTYNQYKKAGRVKLFKSHKKEYADGGQLRDFIYVKDVVSIIYFLLTNKVESGIYNIGTGIARSFFDLSMATIKTAAKNDDIKAEDVIEYVSMPEDLQGRYQYFTQATMKKLHDAGYTKEFYTLEDGVSDYVSKYLAMEDKYL